MRASRHARWLPLLREALPISLIILALFYYWFGVADRYIVFLYGHTANNIVRAQPFDAITSSRYWMSGLVAAGVVMVLYTTASYLCGRMAAWRGRRFLPAIWWQVWALAAVPLAIGIPAITMTVNTPTLPPALAAACIAATLLGLALALLPGRWAAERPRDLAWLVADGLGLMPALLVLRVVELPSRGLSISPATARLYLVGSLVAGCAWLATMSLLRLWRHKGTPSPLALLLTGLGLSYVLMPLVHHLVGTPPAYRYISTAGNFFAFHLGLQGLVIMVAAALALIITAGRRWLMHRAPSRAQPAR